jgi:hypothetical protein
VHRKLAGKVNSSVFINYVAVEDREFMIHAQVSVTMITGPALSFLYFAYLSECILLPASSL